MPGDPFVGFSADENNDVESLGSFTPQAPLAPTEQFLNFDDLFPLPGITITIPVVPSRPSTEDYLNSLRCEEALSPPLDGDGADSGVQSDEPEPESPTKRKWPEYAAEQAPYADAEHDARRRAPQGGWGWLTLNSAAVKFLPEPERTECRAFRKQFKSELKQLNTKSLARVPVQPDTWTQAAKCPAPLPASYGQIADTLGDREKEYLRNRVKCLEEETIQRLMGGISSSHHTMGAELGALRPPVMPSDTGSHATQFPVLQQKISALAAANTALQDESVVRLVGDPILMGPQPIFRTSAAPSAYASGRSPIGLQNNQMSDRNGGALRRTFLRSPAPHA